MNRRATALLSVLVLLPFAGCLANPTPTPSPTDSPFDVKTQALLDFLDGVPELTYDPLTGVNWWEHFATTYDRRQWPQPNNMEAAAYLESELKAAGLQATTLYVAPPQLGTDPGVAPLGYRVIQGLKTGTTLADHRLVLVSHYDTVYTTGQGAYDDAAGVAILLQVCKALSKVPMNRTLECLFFDNEEDGLLASGAYTQWYAAEKRSFTWDQAFGYDMTGLNWPGYTPWTLDAHIGKPANGPASIVESNAKFLEVIAHTHMNKAHNGSDEGINILRSYGRSSDEMSFMRVGVPVVRWAGGPKSGDYPEYHQPGDTVDFVYDFACGACGNREKGKAAFAAGFEMVVLMSYVTILAYDHYDPKALPV